LFSHITVGSNDLTRAMRFYSKVLKPLGYGLSYDGRHEGWLGFHDPSASKDPVTGKSPSFWVCAPIDGQPASVGNGVNIGFDAPDRPAVDAAHAAAVRFGGEVISPPAIREYHPNFYATYLRDPDGNKLCVVCHKPE
jgi:predicted enzyme related to lactoylglutathione lyase